MKLNLVQSNKPFAILAYGIAADISAKKRDNGSLFNWEFKQFSRVQSQPRDIEQARDWIRAAARHDCLPIVIFYGDEASDYLKIYQDSLPTFAPINAKYYADDVLDYLCTAEDEVLSMWRALCDGAEIPLERPWTDTEFSMHYGASFGQWVQKQHKKNWLVPRKPLDLRDFIITYSDIFNRRYRLSHKTLPIAWIEVASTGGKWQAQLGGGFAGLSGEPLFFSWKSKKYSVDRVPSDAWDTLLKLYPRAEPESCPRVVQIHDVIANLMKSIAPQPIAVYSDSPEQHTAQLQKVAMEEQHLVLDIKFMDDIQEEPKVIVFFNHYRMNDADIGWKEGWAPVSFSTQHLIISYPALGDAAFVQDLIQNGILTSSFSKEEHCLYLYITNPQDVRLADDLTPAQGIPAETP